MTGGVNRPETYITEASETTEVPTSTLTSTPGTFQEKPSRRSSVGEVASVLTESHDTWVQATANAAGSTTSPFQSPETFSADTTDTRTKRLVNYFWRLRERSRELEERISLLEEARIAEAAALLTRTEARFLLSRVAKARSIETTELATGLRPAGWLLVASLVKAGLLTIEGNLLLVTREGANWAKATQDALKAGVL